MCVDIDHDPEIVCIRRGPCNMKSAYAYILLPAFASMRPRIVSREITSTEPDYAKYGVFQGKFISCPL